MDGRQNARWMRRGLAGTAAAGLVALSLTTGLAEMVTVATLAKSLPAASSASGRARRPAYPKPASIEEAWDYARARPGVVSLAVVDSRGRLHHRKGHRRFVSASVVKAIMLAAYLREASRGRQPLDRYTRQRLGQMITFSDNGAADEIYYRLGDAPLERLARPLGLRDFSVEGYWASTYLSATDCARFMWRLGRALPDRYERFARHLLAGVVSYQRWGIPAAAGRRWRIWFKGGWRGTASGQLTSQMALLRHHRIRIALAVLTDGNPSQLAGQRTLEGVTRRLLRGPAGARATWHAHRWSSG
jgi:Beta-lactamase enzyme family